MSKAKLMRGGRGIDGLSNEVSGTLAQEESSLALLP